MLPPLVFLVFALFALRYFATGFEANFGNVNEPYCGF
jgi:hypothetical protein